MAVSSADVTLPDSIASRRSETVASVSSDVAKKLLSLFSQVSVNSRPDAKKDTERRRQTQSESAKILLIPVQNDVIRHLLENIDIYTY